MTSSRYSEITDELLSAYIDNVVTERERELVEEAVREDASVAWRLATLRETVQLLHALPMLQAPRSFMLTAEQLNKVGVEPTNSQLSKTAQRASEQAPSEPGAWAQMLESWRRFWRGGSPVWRNAMAASFAALLVLLVLPAYLAPGVQQSAAVTTSSDLAAVQVIPAEPSEANEAASAADAPSDEVAKAAAESPEVATPLDAEQVPAPQAPVTAQENTTASAAIVQRTAATDTTAVRIIPSTDSREEDALAFDAAVPPATGEGELLIGAAAAPAPPMAAPGAESAAASTMQDAPGSTAVTTAVHLELRRVEPATAAAAQDEAAALAESVESITMEEPVFVTATAEHAAATARPTVATITLNAAEPDNAQPSVEKPAAATAAAVNTPQPTVTTAPPASTFQLLPWLQLAAALAVVGFAVLWWYSRHPQTGT